MLTLTKKEIKNFDAIDITTKKEKIENLEIFAKSYGIYGMNGAILKDRNGNFYKIIDRVSNLFRYC